MFYVTISEKKNHRIFACTTHDDYFLIKAAVVYCAVRIGSINAMDYFSSL